jgi:hypothetical protein
VTIPTRRARVHSDPIRPKPPPLFLRASSPSFHHRGSAHDDRSDDASWAACGGNCQCTSRRRCSHRVLRRRSKAVGKLASAAAVLYAAAVAWHVGSSTLYNCTKVCAG